MEHPVMQTDIITAVVSSVLNLENSPHQQLTGELIGENISPVRVGEL